MKVRYANGLAPDDFLRVFTNGGASYLQFAPFPEVRTMTHLHGGFVAGDDDGNPFAQPDAFRSGATQSVTYPNEQPATLLWYHDHYLGDTRMNVVAGLAGGYLLRDSFDTGSQPAAARPDRGLRAAGGGPGPAVQPGRVAAVPGRAGVDARARGSASTSVT